MQDESARSLVPPEGWLGPASGEKSPLSAGFLALATLLAAVLRLGGLTRQSLWVDELMTWQMIRPGAGLDFLEQVRDSIQGPLYVAVIWPLVRLGDPELMLRLPAAVAGVLTVPLFAAVAVHLLERRAARLAVLLVAINPFLIWYSQEARGYAFAVFFGVAMVLAFLRLRDRGVNRGDGVLFALASAAAVGSNLSGLFLWAALGVTVLLQRPAGWRERSGWALAFGGGLLAALPWLLQAAGIWAVDRIVPGSGTGEALRGGTNLEPLALPYTLFSFFYGFSFGPSLRELHEPERLAAVRAFLPWLVVAGLPLLVGGVAGVVGAGRRRWPLLLWVGIPLLCVARAGLAQRQALECALRGGDRALGRGPGGVGPAAAAAADGTGPDRGALRGDALVPGRLLARRPLRQGGPARCGGLGGAAGARRRVRPWCLW